MKGWLYNEMEQVGKDYAKLEEVERYDARHSEFRNIDQENNAILDTLGVKKGDVLVDFGAGTGSLAICAAKRELTVLAVDVSLAMLQYAKRKAAKVGVTGISFHHHGFLSFAQPEKSVDQIVSTFAFHHLPDFWKGIALNRMRKMLKVGGKLYLHDIIVEEQNVTRNITQLIEKLSKKGGSALRQDLEDHFAMEFSTYDWILDGLLKRAGFEIMEKRIEDGVLGTYLCRT